MWPTEKDVKVTSKGYETPDGLKPRVTTILKVLGLGTEALIRWSADLERDAVLEAAGEVYAHADHYKIVKGVMYCRPKGE